jgi:hypothetical protein
VVVIACLVVGAGSGAVGGEGQLRQEALAALRNATSFYRAKVASHGGYVYYYSVDL